MTALPEIPPIIPANIDLAPIAAMIERGAEARAALEIISQILESERDPQAALRAVTRTTLINLGRLHPQNDFGAADCVSLQYFIDPHGTMAR